MISRMPPAPIVGGHLVHRPQYQQRKRNQPTLVAQPVRCSTVRCLAVTARFSGSYWQEGFCHSVEHIACSQLDELCAELDLKVRTGKEQDRDKLHHRNAHLEQHVKSVQSLLNSPNLLASVRALLGEHGVLVRSTLIDKPAGSPWHVQWHQDRSPLSYPPNPHQTNQEKAQGNQLIAVRIHLDPSNDTNGGLEVIPQTHRHGLLSQKQIDKALLQRTFVLDQPRGCVMFMHPYLLHASAPNLSDQRRRIIHCEYITASTHAALVR